MISQLTVLICLTLLNAIFAMTEIAFISLNDAKIAKLAKEGDKKSIDIPGTYRMAVRESE